MPPIAERVRPACAAGEAKRAARMPLRDEAREEATLAMVSALAREQSRRSRRSAAGASEQAERQLRR